jgi:hypothetical protein
VHGRAKITLQPDFRELLSLLIKHEVRFLSAGGYAVGVHGYPRSTGDLDVFVAISQDNVSKLAAVFREFGFDTPESSEEPLLPFIGYSELLKNKRAPDGAKMPWMQSTLSVAETNE